MLQRSITLAIALVAVAATQAGGLVRASGTSPGSRPFMHLPPPAASAPLAALAGSVLPGITHTRRLARVTPSRGMTVSVYLGVQKGPLVQFLAQLYDPSSPVYRHFLTPRAFASRFGPSPYERSRVAAWLEGLGLRVTTRSPNGLELTAQGSSRQFERAFHTTLYTYWRDGMAFRANAEQVQIPSEFAGTIVAIAGLTDIPHLRTVTPRIREHAGFSPDIGATPADIARLYNLGALYGRGVNGTGQTIAIVSHSEYDPANVSAYARQFSFSPNVHAIAVDDGTTVGARRDDGQQEADLDVEMAQGIAPRARILVYEAENSDAGAIAMYDKIVSDGTAHIVTTSWGDYEGAFVPDSIKALHQILQEAAAQGQTVFAASGDNGAFDQAADTGGDPHALAVDYPASDPWVTGVGGTQIQPDGSEAVWSDKCTTDNLPEGSGGGLSTLFTRPPYQSGPGVLNSYSNGMRQVPDIAAFAGPPTGIAAYTVNASGASGWGSFCGTSIAAPVWAGMLALVSGTTTTPIGFLNPILYTLGARAVTLNPSPFHDITAGSNLHFPATPGWDFGTGWGSVDGSTFVEDLPLALNAAQTPTPTPSPVPTRTSAPIPTPSPIVKRLHPTIAIDQLIVMHPSGGHQKETKQVRVREKVTFLALYHVTNPGTVRARGRLILLRAGKKLGSYVLTARAYHRHSALAVSLTVPSSAGPGTLTARFDLTLGTIHVTGDRQVLVVGRFRP